MDDSIIFLADNSLDDPIANVVNPDKNGDKKRFLDDDDDEDDDFVVPLPKIDDDDNDLYNRPIVDDLPQFHKSGNRTRTRKVGGGKDFEKAAAAERKNELKALKLAQQQERKELAEKKKIERSEKRMIKQAEQLLKKEHRQATRARQPKSLIKTIMILIDRKIEKFGNLDAFEKQARENLLDPDEPVALEFVDSDFPYSITWKIPRSVDVDDGGQDSIITSNELLIVLPVSEFINLVYDQQSNLRSYFKNLKEKTDQKITLVIFGYDDYLLNYKTLKNRQHRRQCGDDSDSTNSMKNLKTFDGLKSIVDPDDIERSLVDLQMTVNIPHINVPNLNELALLIKHFTKAIVEKPEKTRKKEMQASFSWQELGFSKGVKIADDGSGRREVWKRVLMQSFSRQDPNFANAIVEKYGNPRQLLKAYRRCDRIELAKNLLSGIDEGGRRRHDASRRIHMVFTCRDPDAVVDRDK